VVWGEPRTAGALVLRVADLERAAELLKASDTATS
jgi:hypothetical protein